MAKFYGVIGFAEPRETTPGVVEDSISERKYYFDILKNTKRWENGDGLNDNLNISNQFSIVTDPYASQHFFAMRYLSWQGEKWIISSAEVQDRRIILTIGGVYNGPTPDTTSR